MTKDIDDKAYWIARHSEFDNIRSSGFKSLNEQSNNYIYKILSEQYLDLLDKLELPKGVNVIDCGFGDGYFLKFFNDNFNKWEVSGFDLSDKALTKAKKTNKKAKLFVADFSQHIHQPEKFTIAHSFDVLYHILDNKSYRAALDNMCNLSEEYVILHEKFLKREPLINASHVRFRTLDFTDQILNSNGFYLYDEIPTHFMAVRLLTYRLNKFFAKLLYGLDKKISRLHPSTQMRLASHRIRVYKRSLSSTSTASV